MPRVKILTDSTADLPPDVIEMLGITVLPVTIHLGQKKLRDGIDVTAEDFTARFAHAPTPPT
ncbi:MAG: DegV family protein, partial [Chloroflexota bacterium]|nr:DegV family protein [Chloroflexota bacterium]